MLLAGVIGQGKSALAKSLAIRSIAAERQVLVPGDPKGEWGIVADAVGGTTIHLGPGLPARINPLDVDGPARASVLTAISELLLARALLPAEHAALNAALTQLADRPAVVEDLVQGLILADVDLARKDGIPVEQRERDAREIVYALRRLTSGDLTGMIDSPTTVVVDPETPMVVLDLSTITGDDIALAVAMTCAAAWLDTMAPAVPTQSRRRWIIYDEGWRLLRSPGQLRRLQAQWKLARSTGTANLLILHRLSDLDATGHTGSEHRALAEGLLADCSTRVLYRQEAEQLDDAARILGLTDTERRICSTLGRGTAVWTTPHGPNVVRHDLTPAERSVVDTDH